ncbi:Fasciclin-like arabinogalactan protein 2 [Ancistrocladus abbreviatus]
MALTRVVSGALPVLFLLCILHSTPSAQAHNITQILDKYPDLSTFNQYLTLTHLAAEINRRQTITVCAVDNAAMSSLLSKGLSLYTIRNVLSLHVLVDYYGAKKLHQLSNGTTLTATLFQATGSAPGNSGYVNITDLSGGKVGFGTGDNSGSLNSFYVKSIDEMPYNISVVQISQILNSAEAEAPTPEPSQLNLTALLAAKGCKAFSALLTSTGAIKTFQDNIDGGLTVFCVSDAVINAFMPKYKNLTDGDKLSLLLYHGLPVYNSMGMFKSNNGAANTLATNGANKYDFTVQNVGEEVTLETKINTAKITGTLLDQDPVAVYKIDKVLMPRELFKVADVPAPAPAPEAESPKGVKASLAPEPDTSDNTAADQTAKKKNGAVRINGGGLIILGMSLWFGAMALM